MSFAYQPDEPVLEHVSFWLQPEEVLGPLGRTGSGKTTISRLLFRLYDVQQGTIFFSGVDIRDLRLADLAANPNSHFSHLLRTGLELEAV